MKEIAKKRKGFFLTFHQIETILMLPSEQQEKLLLACYAYHKGDEYDLTDSKVAFAFNSFKPEFEAAIEHYQAVCEKRSGAIKERWKKTKEKQTNTNELQNNTNVFKCNSPVDQEQVQVQEQEKEEINIPSNSEFAGFVNAFQSAVTERYGKTAPTVTNGLIKKSIEALEKAKNLDGFDGEEIQLALWWAYDNQFWGPNIKSLAQIRKKGADDTSKLQKIIEQYRKRNNTANLETKKPFWETMGNVL